MYSKISINLITSKCGFRNWKLLIETLRIEQFEIMVSEIQSFSKLSILRDNKWKTCYLIAFSLFSYFY